MDFCDKTNKTLRTSTRMGIKGWIIAPLNDSRFTTDRQRHVYNLCNDALITLTGKLSSLITRQ